MADGMDEHSEEFRSRWRPQTYRIIRTHFGYPSDKRPRVIKRGLSLDEAQAHCRDPETSHKSGPPSGWWFDGYEAEE